ncbi:MAG: hypothetical protein IT460_02190 [Planctomycetes bacterium]|nr:hypothetical protein [Planctomycetota bacterium]
MRTPSLALAFALAAAATAPSTALADDAPRVVRAEPADGAVGVPVNVGVLRVAFDRPMAQDGWTLWQVDGARFPPLVAPDENPWRDPFTMEVRLARLDPGVRYAVQLNAARARRFGFRSSVGKVPLADTRIAFTTGGTTPTDAGPVPDLRPALVGTWRRAEPGRSETMELADDGAMTLREGERTTRARWDFSGAELTLAGASQTLLPTFPGPDMMTLDPDAEHEGTPLRREGARPPGGGGPWLGSWRTKATVAGAFRRYTFAADGSVTVESVDAEGQATRTHRGTFVVERDRMTLTMGSVHRCVLETPERLRLVGADGREQAWVRVPPPPAPPVPPPARAPDAAPGRDALVGTWAHATDDTRVELVLGADGRYRATYGSGEHVRTSVGTWRVEGARLVAREDGEDEDESQAYEQPDADTLVLDGARFTRRR